jgi:Mannosylglycerate hydrolase MGH1-like glycoside hydrolase domain/Glycosyl hydrolase family 65, C-terminal domain
VILKADNFKHYVDRFNGDDGEDVVNEIPNAASWDWISANAPLFECPDKTIEQIYYYRWWTFRKHIKQTPVGHVVTEFILPVKHAGIYNTVSCALGHHIAEARWLRDQQFLDEWIMFWFRGNDGKPQPHFHKYSQWIAAGVFERARVTGDISLANELLNDLVADYDAWVQEKRLPSGLFWQYDVWDGMEESISGGRKSKNVRPTINSYMWANARAIMHIAGQSGRFDVAERFRDEARAIRGAMLQSLWDENAKFFKVMFEDGTLSDAREAIGFIPWVFAIPSREFDDAWKQLADPEGFWAPFGITTAERRHAKFRSHGVGHCEWDGAVWPFATSQTLDALANVLRFHIQPHVTKSHYLEAMQTYARSHQMNGKPYIGEYLDEKTGEWLKGDNPRSRYYNHSTFCDLVISGLAGVQAQLDGAVEINPLLPADAWDYFCLDNVRVGGKTLTVLWDRTGTKYNRGIGLRLLHEDRIVASSEKLEPIRWSGQL